MLQAAFLDCQFFDCLPFYNDGVRPLCLLRDSEFFIRRRINVHGDEGFVVEVRDAAREGGHLKLTRPLAQAGMSKGLGRSTR